MRRHLGLAVAIVYLLKLCHELVVLVPHQRVVVARHERQELVLPGRKVLLELLVEDHRLVAGVATVLEPGAIDSLGVLGITLLDLAASLPGDVVRAATPVQRGQSPRKTWWQSVSAAIRSTI